MLINTTSASKGHIQVSSPAHRKCKHNKFIIFLLEMKKKKFKGHEKHCGYREIGNAKLRLNALLKKVVKDLKLFHKFCEGR